VEVITGVQETYTQTQGTGQK